MANKYGLYWKGKLIRKFKTEQEAETFKGIEMTQMELAEYSEAQLNRYFKIKKLR